MKSDADANLLALFKAHGLRMTSPRRIILQVLAESSDHPDAVELHRRAQAIDPRIAIATVYRTLNLLQDKGALERHTFADGRGRFESAEQEHHAGSRLRAGLCSGIP